MNRQDQIFEYAFGEMSAQDAQVFEASLLNDFEAQKEINLLKGIRTDYSLLSDIPEMQFSKERLRDAILDQGMQPKARPTFNWLQWIMAPVAVASMVMLSFVMLRGQSGEGPALVGSGSKPPMMSMTVPGSGSGLDNKFAAEDSKEDKQPLVASAAKIDNSGQVEVKRKPLRRSNRNYLVVNTAPKIKASPVVESAKKEDVMLINSTSGIAAPAGPGGGGGGGLGSSNAVMASSASSETVVMIDKEQESGVGAVVATEVSVNSDVVIGG